MKTKEKKVLIIYPSVFYSSQWGNICPVKPHLVSLFSFLKNKRFDVDVLDLEVEIGRPKSDAEIKEFKKKAKDLISCYSFDIVGISCWSSMDYLSSIKIAEICKRINSQSTIVVGGYHPSAVPTDFIYKNSPFDFIVQGEGEIALERICKGEEKKDGKAKIIQRIRLDLGKEDLSLDWRNYKYIALRNKEISVHLSRGCPFSCVFCMERTKNCRKWHCFSVAESIYKIEKIIDTLNPKKILIMDACFGYNKGWRREFLERLIKRKIDKLFYAEVRIDLMEKEDIDLFSKLNFVLDYGMESASEKMLYIMKKTNNPRGYLAKCKDIISYTNKKRLYHRIFLIFNHPGEDRSTYKETIQFFKDLLYEQKSISTYIGGQPYFFTPGSYIYHNLEYYKREYGTIILNKEWWKERGDHYQLATSVIASRDFIDKSNCQDYWRKEIDSLRSLYLEKMAGESKVLFWTFWRDMRTFEHKKL